MQHGAILQSHLGYHADDFIVNHDEYATYLPDILYSFGDYWKQYIDWKYEIISVGSPHLNRYIKQYAREGVIYFNNFTTFHSRTCVVFRKRFGVFLSGKEDCA